MRKPRLTAVPAARSRFPVLQIRLALVLGSLLFAALMGIISTVAWINNKPAAVDLSGNVAYGRGVAQVAVNTWLDGKNVLIPGLKDVTLRGSGKPLPHGDVVWDSFKRQQLPGSGLIYERHSFITTIDGKNDDGQSVVRLVKVSVTVAFPAGQQAVLAAAPSLEPVDPRSYDGSFDYSDLRPKAVPGNVPAQLQAWAEAYASDDRSALKQLTGDGTAGVEYAGIGGFALDSVSVVNAIPAGATTYGADTWLVRARILLIGANEFSSVSEMDITVVSASSGLPRIVGWGPAGVGLLGPLDTRRNA